MERVSDHGPTTMVHDAQAPPEAFALVVSPPAGPAEAEPPSVATESSLPVPEPTAVDRTFWPAGVVNTQELLAEFFAAQ